MRWARSVSCAVLVLAAVAAPLAAPAAANHDSDTLWVTVAINAAGDDRLGVTDDAFDSTDYVGLASDVAIALDRPAGSFRTVEELTETNVLLRDKLAQPDDRGGLSYSLDTGRLQLLAQGKGYGAVAVKVCTPRVRQLIDTLVSPESVPGFPGSRCRGWYQPVDEPPIRAVVQLTPDRQRYPHAVGRILGATAISFGILGIGATLLRRGPLRRRSVASWLLSIGSALGVAPLGWTVVTVALWLSAAPADPLLLSGGSAGEQVARTMLPGLAFLLPALLPAAILLTVARKDPRPAVAPAPPQGPPAATWWPTAWWPQWAGQSAPPAPYPSPPGTGMSPRPPGVEPALHPPLEPPSDQSGWALPGSGGG